MPTSTKEEISNLRIPIRRLLTFAFLAASAAMLSVQSPSARAQAAGNSPTSGKQAAKDSADANAKLEAEKRDAAAKDPVSKSGKPAEVASSDRDYVIGSQDVLSIDVWREPEITRSVPVRPDGKISLPLVGEVVASGLTVDLLQTQITKALASYIRDPQVTVIVQESNSHKFNIIGSVARPGVFPLTPNMSALDAIAAAGGFRDFAKIKSIYVLRRMPDGTRKRMPFNYKAAVEGKAGYQDLELQTGDTVVVP